nr:MAG TPA_asm: hypothetical protein [Caudoviricetes sp.]
MTLTNHQRCHHWHWYRRAWLKYVKQDRPEGRYVL